MNNTETDPKLIEQLKKLEEKYEAMGQDLSSYLDGLLYSDYLKYWDYIHLETLLSLQNPKTGFKDEIIFICYHQITELYFKLILWEMEQIVTEEDISATSLIKKQKRINNYFHQLVHSFTVMTDGMDHDEFLKFRMALLPASGFQSAQYRLIEIYATDLNNLVHVDFKDELANESNIQLLYDQIYWKQGANELASGKKTLTLTHFEEKYSASFIQKAYELRKSNLWQIFKAKMQDDPEKETLIEVLRSFDLLANVNWPLAHYKSAVRYLHKKPEDIKATGGSNWQKYLPPRFQKIMFYPELWSEEELKNWGKTWVDKEVFGK
ncbi:tryptophan 2,3-dioxygenase family protein [Fulvivirgaceae bacterium BMA10]|uniref:Tryptophan 2,3-dioxygenase family protein n=1 Tax=Splendidivirga corallicola TaxID=3051826 RepID=A0ABT8KSR0_9BACT|nr:tryptophan 2,3-dioxygenase family protein [Fulvivirgaceae bacterium BMA10]